MSLHTLEFQVETSPKKRKASVGCRGGSYSPSAKWLRRFWMSLARENKSAARTNFGKGKSSNNSRNWVANRKVLKAPRNQHKPTYPTLMSSPQHEAAISNALKPPLINAGHTLQHLQGRHLFLFLVTRTPEVSSG